MIYNYNDILEIINLLKKELSNNIDIQNKYKIFLSGNKSAVRSIQFVNVLKKYFGIDILHDELLDNLDILSSNKDIEISKYRSRDKNGNITNSQYEIYLK